jgi:hypothetical protein
MTTCEKCISWLGDSSSYSADCAKNVLTRPPFHATCPEWQAKDVAQPAVINVPKLAPSTVMGACPRCKTVGATFVYMTWRCHGCGHTW